jgi:hypothetical protein
METRSVDWNIVISRNHALLLRIVAELFAMARSVDVARPATLPRHIYNAIMLILRPAESAVRRLIIIAARGLVLKAKTSRPISAGAFSISSAGLTRVPRFALLDPLKQFDPDMWNQDVDPAATMYLVEADDPAVAYRQAQRAALPVNAALLFNRLRAMRLALNDLPRQARRLARWRARRDMVLKSGAPFRPTRMSPFRPGPPPGYRRKELHQVDAVLKDVHYFAVEACNPDTS